MGQIDKYWDKIHLQYNSTYDNWLNKYVYLFNKNSRIIELGCGRAYCSKYLLDNGFKNIVACDISQEVLKMVNSSIPELKTLLFDMSNGLPFSDNSKDVIIADLSLHYFDLNTTNYIFDEIYRVLANDGLLIARVNAIIRRCSKNNVLSEKAGLIKAGNLTIDDELKKVVVDGKEVKLTPTEYNILKFLTQNKGKVYSIDEIYTNIWEEESFAAENIIAVHIRHIREKIEVNPKEPKYLKVIWGVGYKVENL